MGAVITLSPSVVSLIIPAFLGKQPNAAHVCKYLRSSNCIFDKYAMPIWEKKKKKKKQKTSVSIFIRHMADLSVGLS